MKNGKVPTLEQKKIMKAHGLNPDSWLVVKNLPGSLTIVSRSLDGSKIIDAYQKTEVM